MRILSNAPSVARVGMPNAIRLSNDAYRGTAQAFYGLANAVGSVNEQVQKALDNKIETSTLKTITEYNSSMNALAEKYSAMPYSETYLQEYAKEAEQIKKDNMKNLMPYEKVALAFEVQSTKTSDINYNLIKENYLKKEEETKQANFELFKSNVLDGFAKESSTNNFLQGLKDCEGAATIFAQGKDEAILKNEINKAKQNFVVQSTSYLLKTGDFEKLNEIEQKIKGTGLERFFPAARINELKQRENNQQKINKAVTFWQDAFSNNIGLVKNAVQNGIFLGSKFTTHNLALADADTPDVDKLKPEFKGVLPVIGGILKKHNFSDGALVTSGYRNSDRNQQSNGAQNSYHLDGDALDIYLPQVGDDTQKAADVYKLFSPYFKEVKYHDAGSGNHLHLAGYKGGLEVDYTEKERQEIIFKVKEDVEYQELVKRIDHEKTMEFGLKHILQQKSLKTISDVEQLAAAYTRDQDTAFAVEFSDRAKKLFIMQQSVYNEEFDEKTFLKLKEELYNEEIVTDRQLQEKMKMYGGGSIEQRRSLGDLFLKRKSTRPFANFFEQWAKKSIERYEESSKVDGTIVKFEIGELPPD